MYEYRCHQCSHRFEKIQSFSAAPETVCPVCKGELYRPLTVPGFNFKGAGWYVNDYASKPAASAASLGDAAPAATPIVAASESAATSAAPASAPAAAPATVAAAPSSNS